MYLAMLGMCFFFLINEWNTLEIVLMLNLYINHNVGYF